MKTNRKSQSPLPAMLILLAALTSRADADQTIWATTAQSTVLIQVPGVGYGSGVLIDATHRLVITAAHVLGDNTEATAIFAQRDSGGRIITGAKHYADHEAAITIKARVLRHDKEHDLVVLQLATLPAGTKAMSLAAQSPTPGETVHVVGNSSLQDGVLFRYSSGFVGSVNAQAGFFETSVPANRGDSGGPVVNNKGEVVGLVSFRDMERTLVKFDIDIHPIHVLVNGARSELVKQEQKQVAKVGGQGRQKPAANTASIASKLFGFSTTTPDTKTSWITTDMGKSKAAAATSTTPAKPAANPSEKLVITRPMTTNDFAAIAEQMKRQSETARLPIPWSIPQPAPAAPNMGERAWTVAKDVWNVMLLHPIFMVLAIALIASISQRKAR